MSGKITVTNKENDFSWEKDLKSLEECQQIYSFLKKRPPNFLKAYFIPLRTHNMLDFSKDFFLPRTVNHAIRKAGKIDYLAGKIFLILASIVSDLLTFPFRLITFIPRIISNNSKVLPFYKYLTEKKADQKLLEAKQLEVQFSCVIEGDSYTSAKIIDFVEIPKDKPPQETVTYKEDSKHGLWQKLEGTL
ncbi:MAG: hypothetical protein K1060chlam1_00477 [Candidatus Anoxychlamydiales bacterium]|nr:hypothetical protein [Candidatus Anoxychlamydiales bacterium]